jgi:hypothetical protein
MSDFPKTRNDVAPSADEKHEANGEDTRASPIAEASMLSLRNVTPPGFLTQSVAVSADCTS